MRQALSFARRAIGKTSPNPMVGAVLVKNGAIIGKGWHRQAGLPHAEIEALNNAQRLGNNPRNATLYVTLEPCCTHGRTPPCTTAIIEARIKKVVVAATDPNPHHSGRGFNLLRKAGIEVDHGILAEESNRLNESFNHWIVQRTPFVTVKAAMTLDGKIATAAGDSKYVTGAKTRAFAMKLRQSVDAILVGINTVLLDNPSLTVRLGGREFSKKRIILDSLCRTPLTHKIVSDSFKEHTLVVVSEDASRERVDKLSRQVRVLVCPRDHSQQGTAGRGRIQLPWLLEQLGRENICSLLVDGGGEVNASFLSQRLAQRICFFYAPKILGGRTARMGVAGEGAQTMDGAIRLEKVEWKRIAEDLFLTARVK